MKLVLTNDFHRTSCTVAADANGRLTPAQVRRARRTLCPVTKCRCGDGIGRRGPTLDALGRRVYCDFILTPEGGARMIADGDESRSRAPRWLYGIAPSR